MKSSGWILDAYQRNDEDRAILWVKDEENGGMLRLWQNWNPSLYIEPADSDSGLDMRALLDRATGIVSVDWVEKKTSLTWNGPKSLLECKFEAPAHLNFATRILDKHPLVRNLFNSDLLQIQLYLFTKLQIEPTRKIDFEYSDSLYLINATRNEDEDIAEQTRPELGIRPPPFTSLYFDIQPGTKRLTPIPQRDPIEKIELIFNGINEQRQQTLAGSERELLEQFGEIVGSADPDFLFAPEVDNYVLPYLKTRAEINGVDLLLGREAPRTPISSKIRKLGLYLCPGRVCLDYANYGYSFDDNGWGIAGLVERSRFACLPPSIAGRWTANRVNDSRICYELIKRGHVIPKNRGAFEFVRTVSQIHERDKGGMILSPKIGIVHDNVAELDFDSLYPNLIVKRNISFETIAPDGHHRYRDDDAILPYVTLNALERRLYLKKLKKRFPVGSQEWIWCEQRQAALKLVLVCIYGTSGCCWNRFGNVLAFEEINWTAREVLIRAKDHAQKRGFEVVKGHTDSLFVKKEGASKSDYEGLAKEISELVGLPMSLDHHYKFLILLPQEGYFSDDSSNKTMEAMTRYFGLLVDGSVLARGIEIRRHDTPKFIKDFETRLIETLFDYDTVEDVLKLGYEESLRLVTSEIDRIMTGELTAEDLMVSKILRKPLSEYNSLFPHVTAALQLAARGKLVRPGDAVDFVFRDADHVNPLCRTVPYELAEARLNYDKEKYRDLLLDAAETVLGPLGFSRALYGYKRTESYDWLKQLYAARRTEAISEIQFEVG